jgi:hypothetical protein
MNGHARWLAEGSLDDLFGIRRASPVRRQALQNTGPERDVRPAAGKALAEAGGAAANIVNSFGSGKTVYLNYFFSTYVEDRKDGKEDELKGRLSQALGHVGIRPPFRLSGEGGRPLRDSEVVAYEAGQARYLGVIKNDDVEVRSEPLSIELGRACHVYDMRRKAYLGRLDRISDTIRTAEPKLYALLPEPVRGVRVTSEAAAARGRRFSYSVALEAEEGTDSVVLVKVYKPGGELVREYSENLEAKGGAAASGFPIALNDPVGTWKLTATDAVSGKQAVREFQVR